MDIDLVVLDPGSPDPALLAGWTASRVEAARFDRPADPPPSPAYVRGDLCDDGFGHCQTWVAVSGGRVTGGIRIALAWGDNQHSCDVDLEVHPKWRRQGIGRRLLNHASDIARADDRRQMTGESETGAEFAKAVGAEHVQTVLRSVLVLDRATVPIGDVARGYELVRWVSPTPDELVDAATGVRQSMADAPMGDLDMQPWTWDARRLRAWEQSHHDRNRTLYTIVARHVDTGALAGLTEVAVQNDEPMRAEQEDTVVVPTHRGHGLGMAMKAEMLRWLRAERPEVAEIETWNADDNGYMLAINRSLGFRVAAFENEWQLQL